VQIEHVVLRFFGRRPSLRAKVEIDSADFDSEKPPLRLRGRILELGGFAVLSDLRIKPGRHTMSFANDRHHYRFEMVQSGGFWFQAELRPQSLDWVARIRDTLGF
jgi:hypothetical protein